MTSPGEREPPKDWWLENAFRIAAFRLRQTKYLSANTIPIREQVRDSVEFVRLVWEEIVILRGDTLATISPSFLKEEISRSIRSSVTIGRHRVLSQDVEFGLAQIVEIGIRALSPAVNDTFTGVACVDLLAEALIYVTENAHRSGRSFDTGGALRLQVRPLLVPRLIKQAFDQIRQAAADNPAVSIRLLTTLGRLSGKITAADARTALLDQADAVWETANSKNPVTMDLEDLRLAWVTSRTLLLQ